KGMSTSALVSPRTAAMAVPVAFRLASTDVGSTGRAWLEAGRVVSVKESGTPAEFSRTSYWIVVGETVQCPDPVVFVGARQTATHESFRHVAVRGSPPVPRTK